MQLHENEFKKKRFSLDYTEGYFCAKKKKENKREFQRWSISLSRKCDNLLEEKNNIFEKYQYRH